MRDGNRFLSKTDDFTCVWNEIGRRDVDSFVTIVADSNGSRDVEIAAGDECSAASGAEYLAANSTMMFSTEGGEFTGTIVAFHCHLIRHPILTKHGF